MADRKISDLTALTAQASGDLLPIVDVSEAAAADKNKSITIQELFRGIPVNVGVGTASPSSLLEVNGGASSGEIKVSATGYTGLQLQKFSANADAVINLQDNGSLRLYTNNNEKVRIDSSGRVGIGTSSPSQLLEVENSSGNAAINITSSDAGYAELYFGDQSSASAAALSYEHSSSKLRIYNDGSVRATIDSSGNVGIGTTSPGAKLDIGGQIRFSNNSTTDNIINTNSNSSRIRIFGGSSASVASGAVISLQGVSHSDGNFLDLASAVGGHVQFRTGTTERARIDSSGRLLVGTSSNQTGDLVQVQNTDGSGLGFFRNSSANGIANGQVRFRGSEGNTATIMGRHDGSQSSGSAPGRLEFYTTPSGSTTPTERMRITSAGDALFGCTTNVPASSNVTGVSIATGSYGGYVAMSRDSAQPLDINRKTNDGGLIQFKQDGTDEGSISVSGTTVSYNGAHLSRWSQLPGGVERTEILRGSVLSNIDEMCEWGEEENEQLNRMQVSNVEGDRNVSGVFQAWDDDDDTYTNDFYCAMTGDFVIRIAQGVTVERGDLLMSAGDGTAKPQDDDIIRSKTIAKVTSTHVSETYADGSYCVPCVLMAC